MLEETRNTITVPASFMLRMLASLNHIRAGENWHALLRLPLGLESVGLRKLCSTGVYILSLRHKKKAA